MKNKKEINWCHILYQLTVIMLVVTHILLLFLIHKQMPYFLDSDMSSEMILSKILSDENRIITDSWYYSTELRVLNNQLVYSFFFRFLKNWHVVRLLSIMVLHCILTCSALYLCKRIGCHKYAPLVCWAILIPFTPEYFKIMLVGCYYIPHIAISFFTVGLCFGYWLILGGSMILALLAGMGGLRQIIVTYLPLAMGIVLLSGVVIVKSGYKRFFASNYFRYFQITILNLFCSGIGYMINGVVLSQKYNFTTWGDIQFTGIDLSKAIEVINGVLITLGYRTGAMSMGTLIPNGICAIFVLFVLLSVLYGLRNRVSVEYKVLTVFFLCNFVVFLLLYTMTDMLYLDRYNYPILIFAIPIVLCGLREFDFGKAPKWTKYGLMIICVMAVFVRGSGTITARITSNEMAERKEMTDFLEQSGYENGYATFWNANVITELTNGEIDMYVWRDSGSGENFKYTGSVNHLYKWLQETDHMYTYPSGKVFTLYRNDEIEYCAWKHHLRDSDMIYQSESYTIYAYEDYSTMISLLTDDHYAFTVEEDIWLKDGEIVDNERILHENGMSYGPYITLRKGEYLVSVTGENLQNSTITAYYDERLEELDLIDLNASDEKVTFRVACQKDCNNSEIVIRNMSKKDIVINGIEIERIE